MYLPANGPTMYLEPSLLVNKPSDELPPGVDPCQREVGGQPTAIISVYWENSYTNIFI